MARRHYDETTIRRWVEDDGVSLSEVARRLSTKTCIISNLCKRKKIVSRHLGEAAEKDDLPVAAVYKRYRAGDSLYLLSKAFKAPIARLKRQLKRHYPEIVFRDRDDALRPAVLNDREALTALLADKSCREIARELGVKVRTVTWAVKRFDLATHLIQYRVDNSLLERLFLAEEMTPRQIATFMELPYGVVLRRLRSRGYEIARPGGRRRPSRFWQLNDKRWLEAHYRELGLLALATEVGTTIGNVAHHLRKHKIAMRSKAEWLKLLAEQHGGRRSVEGVECDSLLEAKFVKALLPEQRATLARGIELESAGSYCSIDFKIGDSSIEVKSREQSEIPGPHRRRLVKQWLVCHHNGIDLSVWNGRYYKLELTDLDRYYCANWKLIFDGPDACADWLIAYGFKGVEWSHGELADGLKKVVAVRPGKELDACFRNEDALKLVKHFSQHYWHSSHTGHLPVAAAWEAGNQVVLRRAVTALWERANEVSLYGLMKVIQKDFKDFAAPSIFKPWVAHFLYQRFLPKGGVVVDPCMGWGGRLLGTADLDIEYVGSDLNDLTVASHVVLAKFVNSRLKIKPTFRQLDAATAKLPAGDLLLTSPPYDDRETYAGAPVANLEAIVTNIFRQFRGMVVLNVPKDKRDRVIGLAAEHKFRLVDELAMETATLFRRAKAFEPILAFKKRR